MIKLGCSQSKEFRSADLSADQTNQFDKSLGTSHSVLSVDQNSTEKEKMLNPNKLLSAVAPKSNTSSELGRKKVVLGKGFSLMDWIRYSKTPNIAGNNGIMRPISYDELSKHNTEDDCWMAIYDKVYNVTPYMKYHPGGVAELMKGAGLNATEIFNDVHPWVNYHSMLERCLIGNLVGKPKEETESISSKSSTNQLPVIDLIPESLKTSFEKAENETPKAPAFDSYHTAETFNIVIYTKWKSMSTDYIIIDQVRSNDTFDNLNLVIHIYIRESVFKLSTEINQPITNNYSVKVNKDGKVDLVLFKSEKNQLMNIASQNAFTCEAVSNTQSGVNYRVCELVEKIKVTADTDVYVFDLPEATRMCVPVGYHVFLKFFNCPDDYPVKPYTVISSSLFSEDQIQLDGKRIYLMIKHYSDGYFTSKLTHLKKGSKIQISNFAGDFKTEKLTDCNELVLICAGSGFTPMIRLLKEAVEIDSIKNIYLLFFNKTEKDILWKQELENFEAKYFFKVKVNLSVTDPRQDWTGKSERINTNLLKEVVFDKISKPLFSVCGPRGFTEKTIELIKKNGFSSTAIFPFVG